ncbi:hypothetical protein Q9189_005926 [Teloschistes chrysophthalmus]
MQFSTLFVMAAAFMVGTSALNIPREAAPEPAGCNGGSYRYSDPAQSLAACQANCHSGCIGPFAGGSEGGVDYYITVCQCN